MTTVQPTPPTHTRVVRHSAVVAAATATLYAMPFLALASYGGGDEYVCGDLGGMGAAIMGWFTGVLVFVATTCAVTLHLRRVRLLVLVPLVVVGHYFLGVHDPLWAPVVHACGTPVSLSVGALLVAAAGGLTYLLARGGVERA